MTINAFLAVAKVVISKGFDDYDVWFLGKEAGIMVVLILVIMFEAVKSVFNVAGTKAVVYDVEFVVWIVFLQGIL